MLHHMQNPKPHGLLRSAFILKTFAPHFKAIAGTCFKESDAAVGALSLACAAVCTICLDMRQQH